MIYAIEIGVLCFHLMAWGAVCHVLLTKNDPRSALGWSAICLMLPVLGVILYALFGIGRTQSKATRLMNQLATGEQPCTQIVTPDIPLEDIPANIVRMAKPGMHLTGHSLSSGNRITTLINGNSAYPAMIEAIQQARHHVFLVSYIFNAGCQADRFIEALSEAVKRGADVRVIIDGVGRYYTLNSPAKKLLAAGVKVAFFLPPKLFPPNLMVNLRNHRKVLICDDIAFTGGMNIADYHVKPATNSQGYVQDVHFKCEGPVTAELLKAFIMDWGFVTSSFDRQLPPVTTETPGDCYCRTVMDGPGGGSDPLNDLIAACISNAENTVRIMTPYFLPTREIVAALRAAAQKEVDVRIVLPAENNQSLVHWASMRLLGTLLKTGVRVFYQPAPFAHTKLMTIDGYYSQIGSANYDSRSLRLNFELNTEIFSDTFAREIEDHINSRIAVSQEITLEDLQQQSTFKKLRNAACWLFSPYL